MLTILENWRTQLKKFRPIPVNALRRIRNERRASGYKGNYNWRNYDTDWWPSSYQINHKTLHKQFIRLHYLAWHAPLPVRQRWIKAYWLFKRRHFANPKTASSYFIDNYTIERWI